VDKLPRGLEVGGLRRERGGGGKGIREPMLTGVGSSMSESEDASPYEAFRASILSLSPSWLQVS
jgi:hypothetical protein